MLLKKKGYMLKYEFRMCIYIKREKLDNLRL